MHADVRTPEEVRGEMKRIGSVVLCCLGVAAIGASVALADNPTPTPEQVASHTCVNQLHDWGVSAFKNFYGDGPKKQHAMRNCKGKHEDNGEDMVNNAAKQCKAEQADPNFAASHDGMTFDQFYGTNHNDKNSFGKCVSRKVHEAQDQEDENDQNAAQQCRAERNPNPDAFRDHYGTNKNKKNAFGKCVSQKAKALNSAPTT
jgi:hypothetical protein